MAFFMGLIEFHSFLFYFLFDGGTRIFMIVMMYADDNY